MKAKKKEKAKAVSISTEVEEGLTVRDVMVIAAESVLIKNGSIKPVSFEEAFEHLKS